MGYYPYLEHKLYNNNVYISKSTALQNNLLNNIYSNKMVVF